MKRGLRWLLWPGLLILLVLATAAVNVALVIAANRAERATPASMAEVDP